MNENKEKSGVIYKKSEYAGLIKRIVIAVVDILVILIVSFVVLFLTDYLIYDETTYLKFNIIFFLIFSVCYLALLKRSKFGTLGYILTGVKIVNLKGRKPSVFDMVFRTLLLTIGPFELFFDIIWLTQESTKQTLRDKYVGTYVINRSAVPIADCVLQNVNLNVMGWNLMYREVNEEYFLKKQQLN